jgi:hypothetical protein
MVDGHCFQVDAELVAVADRDFHHPRGRLFVFFTGTEACCHPLQELLIGTDPGVVLDEEGSVGGVEVQNTGAPFFAQCSAQAVNALVHGNVNHVAEFHTDGHLATKENARFRMFAGFVQNPWSPLL